ncbi:hypothetical protein MRX96_025393 [Rhipicephalus microplus]
MGNTRSGRASVPLPRRRAHHVKIEKGDETHKSGAVAIRHNSDSSVSSTVDGDDQRESGTVSVSPGLGVREEERRSRRPDGRVASSCEQPKPRRAHTTVVRSLRSHSRSRDCADPSLSPALSSSRSSG